ncbi:hypothetical protein AAF712_012567 [Marasmius tenuissimus]|uniref:F-box domain-containing protein n=1 Tax=Marasmius tenuissimus TaxID=585030 RepID=A0ABR2ZI19_9AGAR
MAPICESCRFNPSIRPPITIDQFRSNSTISPETLIQTTSVIEDEERNIGQYESEILRVRYTLATLEKEKRVLEEQVKQRRSYVSCLRRIPHELWVEIFLSSLRMESDAHRFAAPFRLSQVSYRWRSIVISTPTLWSTIVYNVRRRVHGRALELYFQRSDEHAWDVTIRNRPIMRRRDSVEQTGPPHGLTGPSQMLIDNMSRIRRLLLDHTDTGILFPTDQPPDPSFSRLECLELQGHMVQYPDWFCEAVRRAPELTTFVVKNMHTMNSDPLLLMSLASSSKLTSLQVPKITLGGRLLEVIRTFQNLDTLTIERVHTDLFVASMPLTTWRSLRRLTLSSGPAVLAMLQSLELPNLEVLHINWLHIHASHSPNALLPVLSRFSSLRELVLSGGLRFLECGTLVDLLPTMPNLSRLSFDALYHVRNEAAPAYSASVAALFPHLTSSASQLESLSISLHSGTITEGIVRALIGMLEAWDRKRLTPVLKSIYVEGGRVEYQDQEEFISRVRALESKGFRCRMNTELFTGIPRKSAWNRETITIRAPSSICM